MKLPTYKYIFNNRDVRITVLSKLDGLAIRGCNSAIKNRNKSFMLMSIDDLEFKEESEEQLSVENFKLLLCEWKRD